MQRSSATPVTPSSGGGGGMAHRPARGPSSPEVETFCPQPLRAYPSSGQNVLPGSPGGGHVGTGCGAIGYDEPPSKEMTWNAGGPVVGPGFAYGNGPVVTTDRRPLSSVSTSAGPTPGLDERMPHASSLLDGLRAGTPEEASGGLSDSKRAQSRKIFVGGIPQDMSQVDLSKVFNDFSPVKKAWLQKFRPSAQGATPPRNHRGFGFVVFEEDGAVESILGHKESKFITLRDGKRLEVKRARSSSEMGSPPNVASGPAAPRGAQMGRAGTPSQQGPMAPSGGGAQHGAGQPMQGCPWPPSNGYPAAPMHFQQPTPMMPMPWADGGVLPHVQPSYAMLPDLRGAQVNMLPVNVRNMLPVPTCETPPPQGMAGLPGAGSQQGAGGQVAQPVAQMMPGAMQMAGWPAQAHAGGMAMAPAAWQVVAPADGHGHTAPSACLLGGPAAAAAPGSPPSASR